MQLTDLIGKRITDVDPLFHNGDSITVALTIEGLPEPVSVDLEASSFENLRNVSFLEIQEDDYS